jgi:hypothetical protein
MGLNRRRLAISAAVVGAIGGAIWPGDWNAFPKAASAFGQARWRQAEDSFFAARNTTREAWRAEESRKCWERHNSQAYKDEVRRLSADYSAEQIAQMTDCFQNGVVYAPEESLASYLSGLAAFLAAIAPLLLTMAGGALLAASLAWLAPAWLHWLLSS